MLLDGYWLGKLPQRANISVRSVVTTNQHVASRLQGRVQTERRVLRFDDHARSN